MTSSARLWLMLLVLSSPAMPQKCSFGLKGGVPVTDALKVTDRSRYFSDKAPYVIGPAFELHLVAGLSAEANLLYRRFGYSDTIRAAPLVSEKTSGQAWEVPLLARGRLPGGLLRPLLLAGFSYRRLANLERLQTAGGTTVRIAVMEPANRSTAGATVGGGVELSLPVIRVSGEMRYTRWGSSSFRSALGGLVSQLNQADFLLGIMF